MTEKGSGEPLMHDSSVPVMESPPPEYPGPTNYMQSSQPGYVKKGQPVHQGYVIQPPPSYGVQYNPTGAVTTVVPGHLAEDHMIMAILVTVFCFFPTGILAIMRASDAKAAASYGDMVSAERHSKSAKKMIKISVIAGIITTMMLIGLVVLYVAMLMQMAPRNMRSNYD